MLRQKGEILPCLTIEAGWAESYPKLVQDVDVWMVGGVAATKISLLIKLNRRAGGRFVASMEAARQVPGTGYAFDPRQVSCNTTFPPGGFSLIGLPQDIFPMVPNQPQTISVTRGDLFGNQLVPGRNAADTWGLDLGRSCEIMRDTASNQGLIPV